MDFDDLVGHLHDCRFALAAELIEKAVYVSFVDWPMIGVTDLEHRGPVTSVEALDFLNGEHAVGRGFAMADAQLLLDVVTDAVGAADMAGKAGAELDLVLARLVGGVVHRVKRRHAFDFGIASMETMGHFGNCLTIKKALIFTLGNPKTWEDTGFQVRVMALKFL